MKLQARLTARESLKAKEQRELQSSLTDNGAALTSKERAITTPLLKGALRPQTIGAIPAPLRLFQAQVAHFVTLIAEPA